MNVSNIEWHKMFQSLDYHRLYHGRCHLVLNHDEGSSTLALFAFEEKAAPTISNFLPQPYNGQ